MFREGREFLSFVRDVPPCSLNDYYHIDMSACAFVAARFRSQGTPLQGTRPSAYSSVSPTIAPHFICMRNYWSRSCLAVRYVASPTTAREEAASLLTSVRNALARETFVGTIDRRRTRIKRFRSERFNRVQHRRPKGSVYNHDYAHDFF